MWGQMKVQSTVVAKELGSVPASAQALALATGSSNSLTTPSPPPSTCPQDSSHTPRSRPSQTYTAHTPSCSPGLPQGSSGPHRTPNMSQTLAAADIPLSCSWSTPPSPPLPVWTFLPGNPRILRHQQLSTAQLDTAKRLPFLAACRSSLHRTGGTTTGWHRADTSTPSSWCTTTPRR